MMMRRTVRRSGALAALLAMALQAFWPVLAQARPDDPTLQVALCTVDGTTHVKDIKIGKSMPLDERAASHGEHCKLCVFGDGKGIALVANDFSPFTPENHSSRNSGTPQAFIPRESLHSVRPRAPPAVS